jgi:hypothetical protein
LAISPGKAGAKLERVLSKSRAFLAKGLAAGPLAQIFRFDIVAGVALRIVVVNRLLDRMPGRSFGHDPLLVLRYTPLRRKYYVWLGLSWMAGLSIHNPWMRTVAFVSITDWKFLKPIFIGDTVHVVTEVTGKQQRGRKRGQVTWKRQLVNQRGEVTQEGVLDTLVELGEVANDE